MRIHLVTAVTVAAILSVLNQHDAATAGTTGVVNVYVNDFNDANGWLGRPQAGANVTLWLLKDRDSRKIDQSSMEKSSAITDSGGYAFFLSLKPGYYFIETSASGKYVGCPRKLLVDVDQTTFTNLDVYDVPVLFNCAVGVVKPEMGVFSPFGG